MMAQGLLILLGTALAVCRSLLSGVVLILWIRHRCTKLWDMVFQSLHWRQVVQGTFAESGLTVMPPGMADLLSVALHISLLIYSTEINHTKSGLRIYADLPWWQLISFLIFS